MKGERGEVIDVAGCSAPTPLPPDDGMEKLGEL